MSHAKRALAREACNIWCERVLGLDPEERTREIRQSLIDLLDICDQGDDTESRVSAALDAFDRKERPRNPQHFRLSAVDTDKLRYHAKLYADGCPIACDLIQRLLVLHGQEA